MIWGLTTSTFTTVHVVISLVGIASGLIVLMGFVLVVQLFQNVPFLHAMAPTQKEPPFAIAQLLVLVLFAVLTVLAARRFRGAPVNTA